MRSSLTFAVLALAAGCQSGPPTAPSSLPSPPVGEGKAGGGENLGLLSRLFRSKPLSTPEPAAGPDGTESETNRVVLGPDGRPKIKKTKHELAIESIWKRGGMVFFEPDDWLQKNIVVADLHGFRKAGAALDSLAPLIKLRDLNLHATSFTDADLERLRGLPNLQTLNLSGTKITDNGLAVLQTLPNLRTLNLNETRITNAGLQYLRVMPNLTELSLYGTKVNDEGLVQLRSMTALHKLTIGGSKSISDRGLMSLAAMPNLRDLTVLSSRVTDSGIEDLKFASSQLKIVH